MRIFQYLYKATLLFSLIFFLVSVGIFLNTRPKPAEKSEAETNPSQTPSGLLATNSNLSFQGDVVVKGNMSLDLNHLSYGPWTGRVLSVDENGKMVLVPDQYGTTTTQTVTSASSGLSFPEATEGSSLYFDGDEWKADTNLFNDGDKIGIFTATPAANLHINNGSPTTVDLIVQGTEGQTNSLTEWRDNLGVALASINAQGKLTINDSGNDHSIELHPTGDAGYLSSSGGALFINNTDNPGTGIGMYSNAGAEALGNMINIKVDNSAYAQAAFYMDYDGNSNGVEIVSNSTDTSSNALAVTGNNPNDSTLGIIGYETGRGTIKVSHNGTGTDSNASGISIDLKGTGTRAQGLFVDSTASGGTLGNLLTLRNQTVARFTVSSVGSVVIGGNGTDTSLTKQGNTVGDQFFIGTNGAFRVQRSATDSEAFRTQINGDTQGRWLGTSDGKLKFGSGSATQDTVMQRIGVGILEVDPSLTVTGNLGVGATSFDTTGDNVLAFVNGTAPAASITNGVELWAEDVASSSELRVRDEAGNITTLSPHNFSLIPQGPSEDLAWSYYSEKNNVAINVDMLAALRSLERLSGEQLVHEKNLVTGEEVVENTAELPALNAHVDDQTKAQVAAAVTEAVSQVEFQKYVSLTDSVWNFISQVIFKARATFENSVEFLANAVFRGPITVNADTSGQVTIPSGTKRFAVTFETAFSKTPIVYVTSKSANQGFSVENITRSGFEVSLQNTLSSSTDFSWLALLSSDGSFNHLKILETSSQGSVAPQVPVETATPEPTSVATVSARVEPSVESSPSATPTPVTP